MLLTAKEALSERFSRFFIWELLMILTFLPTSSMEVVRMPISLTTPRKPSISTMSPTLYWFSKSMKVPVTTSSMRLSAPKPTTRATIPTLATMVLTSTPRIERPQQRMTTAATYLRMLAVIVTRVRARPLSGWSRPRIRTSRDWTNSTAKAMAKASSSGLCTAPLRK